MAARKSDQRAIRQLKVTIKHIEPPIWRRLQVPADIKLAALHDVLQTAFGWTDSHLHQFVIGDVFYGLPDPDFSDWGRQVNDERRARLHKVTRRGVKRFVYEYDFGDGWEHQVILEKVLAPEEGVAYPRCVAGARACPLEDCGGPWGYQALLEAILDPDHPDYDEMSEWLDEDFDSEAFDLEAVNARLQPRRRRKAVNR